MLYSHTQRSPLKWIFLAGMAGMWGAAWAVREQPIVAYSLLGGSLAFGVCGLAFARMTIQVKGNELLIRSGPLPLIAAMARLGDITEVRQARTSILDGWGLHYFPGRGWTYNIWGRDCVEVFTATRRLRLGTDDANRLCSVLREHTSGKREEATAA